MKKTMQKEKNEVYIINQVTGKPGCFKAQKVVDENEPEPEAPQPDEAPPRGIWFKIYTETLGSSGELDTHS